MNSTYTPPYTFFNMPHGHLLITGGSFTSFQNTLADTMAEIHQSFKGYVAHNATHDSNEVTNPPRCRPGTRAVILQDLQDWVWNPSRPEPVLWLFGNAGVGKTALAQSLAEMLEEAGLLAASFFYRKTDSENEMQNGAKFLVTTIAYQLALSVRELRPYIAEAVKEDPSIFHKSLLTQFRKLIAGPVAELVSSSRERNVCLISTRLIIIDGLEQCNDPQDRHILDAVFGALPVLDCRFKFLILSRPEPRIRSSFVQYEQYSAILCLQLTTVDLTDCNGTSTPCIQRFTIDMAHTPITTRLELIPPTQSLHTNAPPSPLKHTKQTTRARLAVLEDTFKTDTKPTAPYRAVLARELDMTPRGVQVWFQNRRAKEKTTRNREIANAKAKANRAPGSMAMAASTGRLVAPKAMSMGRSPRSGRAAE